MKTKTIQTKTKHGSGHETNTVLTNKQEVECEVCLLSMQIVVFGTVRRCDGSLYLTEEAMNLYQWEEIISYTFIITQSRAAIAHFTLPRT